MRVKSPDKIRRKRKRMHLSQAELAFLVKRSQQSISLIESGKMRNISEAFALALSARLDEDWEDLFDAHEIEVGTAITSAVHSTEQVPA